MDFLHCKIQFGNAGVIDNFNSSITPSPNIDFVTGGLSIVSPPPWQWSILPGPTIGVPTTSALVASDIILDVSDTSAMSQNEKIGIELNTGSWFWTRIDTVNSGTGVTIDDGLPSAAAVGNRVAVVSQLEGQTDFTIEHDFKLDKATRVINKTERLRDRGVSHDGRKFEANTDFIAMMAAIDISTINKGTFYLYDKDRLPYDVPNTASFNALKDAIALRIRQVHENTTGEAFLINSIVSTDNTLSAMNAIIDTRQ